MKLLLLVASVIALCAAQQFITCGVTTCGSNSNSCCGTQCYDNGQQICYGTILCPLGFLLCGSNCYNNNLQFCDANSNLIGIQNQTLAQQNANDIDILNFALTLEHLEYAFYRDGLTNFTLGDFVASGLNNVDLALLSQIRDHELEHVQALTATILQLGGIPVRECQYAFGYGRNLTTFLSIASLLENTGVSAYAGQIANFFSKQLQTVGATIATVEARHASYLNLVNNLNPFPDAFDLALNRTTILAGASPFITSCPSA